MNARIGARLACLAALALAVRQAAAQPAAAGTTKGTPLTAEQKERLQERARVLKEVNRLLQAGKHAEVVALWGKETERDRKAFGRFHEVVADSIMTLAQLHELRDDFPAAAKALREMLAIRTKLYGAKDWRVTDARLDLQSLEQRAQLKVADRRRLAQATALEAQAFSLGLAGRSREALPLARQALMIRKDVLGEEHRDYAKSLLILMSQHKTLKQLKEAAALCQQARDLCKRVVGEAHPYYAISLYNLARLYQDMGEYRKALPLMEKEPDLFKRLLGEAHPFYARALNDLAALYRRLAEYGKALPLMEQARDLAKRHLGDANPDYARSLSNLGMLYLDLAEYGKALPLLEQARDLYKRHLGEADPDYAQSLNNLAGLYQQMGEYGKALPLLEQARDLRRRHRGETHPDYAWSLNNLATLYQDLGEHGKAQGLLEQARDLFKQLGEAHPHYATSLDNLAVLYQELGEYGKALTLREQARDLYKRFLGEAHPDYAICLNGLALLYQELGEHEKALPLAEQARDLFKRHLGEAHPRYANSLNNLATLYQALGEHGKALPLYVEARDLYKRHLGEAHPRYANSLNNLAWLYWAMEKYGKALPLLEQARDLRKRHLGEGHPHYAQSLHNLAVLYRAMKDTAKAAKLAEQSRALHQAFLDRTFTDQSSRQRYNLLQKHRSVLSASVSFALDAGPAPAALYEAVLAWKGALAARAAEERLARDRPELRPLVERLRLARAGLARVASRLPANQRQQAEWRALFDRLEKEKEGLETRLAQQSAAYLRWKKLRQVDAGQVRAALPRGVALVDFLDYVHSSPSATKKGRWEYESRLLAFVLRRERPPVLVPLGSAKGIDAAVRAWRRAVQAHQSPEAAAAELSRRVWRPLEKHLGGVERVLIAPDGVLTGLSFAALPGRKAGTYLLEDVALGYVTSGRQLLEAAAKDDGPPGRGLLAVGGLDYGAVKARPGAAAKQGYGYLPGTRLEAERVGRLFRQQFPGAEAPRLLTGKDVDADALKGRLPPTRGAGRPRYLHLATHGFFEAPSPQAQKLRPWERPELLPFALARDYYTFTHPLLRCGLALAGTNADPERGILRAEEVADLDLRGCQLAVLSACETALGKADREGVQSLQRAFQAAGARSLVVSLWRVHDAATSVLMEEFYQNLWQKKLSRLEALRQAQLTVLRDPGRVQRRQKELNAELLKRKLRGPEDEPEPLPKGGAAAARSHPALWAAFILSGDPGPVAEGPARARPPGKP
jgi:CHAT domain-containing protein